MKKFVTITISLMLFGINLSMAHPAFAEPDDVKDLAETTFNIREYLKLTEDPQDQPAAYYFDPKYSPIVSFIIRIINFATRIIGSIAIVLFIVSGFLFMTATGNQQRVEKAKDIAVYAIIGLVVTFLAYVITIFVQSVFIPTETEEAQANHYLTFSK